MSKEAIKLALEALNKLTDAAGGFSVSGVYFNEGVWEKECLDAAYDSIKALEEALANHCEDNLDMVKQEQKRPQNCGTTYCSCIECVMDEQEQGEPVAWMRQDGQRVTTASDRHNYPDYETRYSIPLYTTQQQRKPLTEEQLIDLWPSLIMHQHTYAFARAIEAAHGIKE